MASSQAGQTRGMLRGWEHYNLPASDKQADMLLERLCRQGVVLPGDRQPMETKDASYSAMLFYEQNNKFHMALEFSEHLPDDKNPGEWQRRDGGLPVYGRRYVTDTQIDSFMQRFPERRGELASRLKEYGENGGQYYTTARPPRDGYFLELDGKKHGDNYTPNPKPVNLRLDAGKSVEQELRRNAPLLEKYDSRAKQANIDSHTMHRIIYEAVPVKDLFPDGVPARPLMSPEAVKQLTGFQPGADGKYRDGYLVTAQVALDKPFSPDIENIKQAQRAGRPPADVYLTHNNIGGQMQHSLAYSPVLAADLFRNSNTIKQPDGRIIGAIEAPVYASDHDGAMRTKRNNEDIIVAGTQSAAQAQDRPSVENLTERRPKGTGYAIDLMSGLARAPSASPDIEKHRKNAAIVNGIWEKYQRGGEQIAQAQGRVDLVQAARDIERREQRAAGFDEDYFPF